MPTLDFTGSSVAGAYPQSLFHQPGGPVVLKRRMVVADIIAADTTMTTNGYICRVLNGTHSRYARIGDSITNISLDSLLKRFLNSLANLSDSSLSSSSLILSTFPFFML